MAFVNFEMEAAKNFDIRRNESRAREQFEAAAKRQPTSPVSSDAPMGEAQAVPTETAVPLAGAEVFARAQADEAFNAFRGSLDEAQRKVVDERFPYCHGSASGHQW